MHATITIIQPDGTISLDTVDAVPPLEFFQKAVGGSIEVVPGFTRREGNPCVAFCNEEGKWEKLPVNPLATTIWLAACPLVQDVLVGPVVIVEGDEEFMRAL